MFDSQGFMILLSGSGVMLTCTGCAALFLVPILLVPSSMWKGLLSYFLSINQIVNIKTITYVAILNLNVMARNNSFIRLEGTLDGLTFYRKNGESFVKTKNSVSKNRIMNDPAYKRTRENMQEFGGGARAGKALRESFAGILRLVGDTYVSARISSVMRNICSLGTGLRGERVIDVVSHVDLFKGFNFNLNKPFDTQFNAPSSPPEIDTNRTTARWIIPDFNTDTYVLVPEGATHFKLALAAGYTSNYEWVGAIKSYEPVDEDVNGRGLVTYSAAIPLGGMVGSDTSLEVDLTSFGTIPVTSAIFAGTAIVFFQEVNGQLYELAQGHAMKIAVGG